MKPFTANLINAAALIAMGLWGYLASTTPSPNELIPLAFGIIFAASSPLVRPDYRLVRFIIALLTVLLTIALFLPLVGATPPTPGQGAIFRSCLMIATCLFASVVYVRTFWRARREK